MLLSVTSQEISEQIVISKHFSITFMNNYTQETISTIQIPKQSNAKNKAIQCRTVLGPAPQNKGNICINTNLQSLKQRKNSSNPTKKKTTSHLTKL